MNLEMKNQPLQRITAFSDTDVSVISKDSAVASNDNIKCVYGIDLGTTNSAISIVREGITPEAIRLESGEFTMPSCVMWKDGKFIVGDYAYENRMLDNVVYSVKRLMQSPGATVTFVDGDERLEMTPAEVSAEVLKGLVKQAGDLYGKIHDVVVTVPAYFNQIGKDNTREACRIAGLNLIALENEPSAAALQYDVGSSDSEDILIYDLGGGTFDVTLARISSISQTDELTAMYGFSSDSESSKIIQPLAIGGDGYLGGDDIDSELLKIVCSRIHCSVDDLSTVYRRQLLLILEGFKKKLGQISRFEFTVRTTLTSGVELNEKISISVHDFQDAALPIYRKTKKIVDGVLREAVNSVAKIILVGGSTRSQFIRDWLKDDYPGMEVNHAFDPDLSVTRGAAVKGRIVKYGDDTITAFDILPLAIGILSNGKVEEIIAKNTRLPAVASYPFTTLNDNQENMSVKIFQGNSQFAAECVELGGLRITGIKKQPAGKPRLMLTIMVSADSLMTCKASIDGIEKELKLNLSGDTASSAASLSREEKTILRWREFAAKLKGNDRAELNAMIDGYPNKVSREQIVNFIMERRK